MIEGWIGSDTHEFPRADFNDGNAGIVMEVGNDVIGHAFNLKSLRDIDTPIRNDIARHHTGRRFEFLARIPQKWIPVLRSDTRQIKKLEPFTAFVKW
ncbi:hypothetical protein NWI01_06770 [Nitrobacter winogradskyi]|uniref:Uncharacterized protein n=1 Tax=Nitrobacter winogradskyi TaxID=913 RepID=A0A4Y3W891_NITWI|nr:hypothetical protein NWI01_06770 [Nitrobacter winogradskyi]